MNITEWLNALMCGLIGFSVGMAELANRYRTFNRIFGDFYSWLYMLINFLASILAYVLATENHIKFDSFIDKPLGKVLFCGLSAMAFLRSSFFNLKDAKGNTFQVGPAAILSIFTKVAETQFDQTSSGKDINEIEPIMKGLNFISASKDLPLLILSSMKVLNAEEQKLLSDEITKLVNDSTITKEVKNITLGLILHKYTGIDLLRVAANQLRIIYSSNNELVLPKLVL